MFRYRYARPALTVDCVVFGCELSGDAENSLKLLLIKRRGEPFQGSWALPGGFVDIEESVDEAARRELLEETGVRCSHLEQLYTFGELGRDPRERVISVAYFSLVNIKDHRISAATDASDAKWWPVRKLPKLAFDHDQIIQVANHRLKAKVCYQPIGFELLPKKFTLTQLQNVYERVLQKSIDKRNFRKKILGYDLLVDCQETTTGAAHRAARLYRFDRQKYRRMVAAGIHFEL